MVEFYKLNMWYCLRGCSDAEAKAKPEPSTLIQQPLHTASTKPVGELASAFASILLLDGNLEACEKAATQGLQVVKEAGDVLGEANLQKVLGVVITQKRTKNILRARERFLEAYNLYKSTSCLFGQAVSLAALGYVHVRMDAFAKAKGFYERALAHFQKIGNAEGQLICYQWLATIHRKLGRMGDEASEQSLFESKSLQCYRAIQRTLAVLKRTKKFVFKWHGNTLSLHCTYVLSNSVGVVNGTPSKKSGGGAPEPATSSLGRRLLYERARKEIKGRKKEKKAIPPRTSVLPSESSPAKGPKFRRMSAEGLQGLQVPTVAGEQSVLIDIAKKTRRHSVPTVSPLRRPVAATTAGLGCETSSCAEDTSSLISCKRSGSEPADDSTPKRFLSKRRGSSTKPSSIPRLKSLVHQEARRALRGETAASSSSSSRRRVRKTRIPFKMFRRMAGMDTNAELPAHVKAAQKRARLRVRRARASRRNKKTAADEDIHAKTMASLSQLRKGVRSNEDIKCRKFTKPRQGLLREGAPPKLKRSRSEPCGLRRSRSAELGEGSCEHCRQKRLPDLRLSHDGDEAPHLPSEKRLSSATERTVDKENATQHSLPESNEQERTNCISDRRKKRRDSEDLREDRNFTAERSHRSCLPVASTRMPHHDDAELQAKSKAVLSNLAVSAFGSVNISATVTRSITPC